MKGKLTYSIGNILLGAGIVLLIVLLLGVTAALDWPLWVGLFLVLLLAGVALIAVIIRRLWLRGRERRFLRELSAGEPRSVSNVAGRERDGPEALKVAWESALKTLRSSHLKKHGNPLYVLPWYLVIGANGSGKSAALNGARLFSPLAEKNRDVSTDATATCDWWFCENAIVIDTAGRYAVPLDQETDQEEWQLFLRLLSKCRRRESLNGLVITVGADRLLSADNEALSADGRTIRRRVEELMTVLGFRFPIYLLVTKCDALEGFADCASLLPENCLDQAMGTINSDLTTDVASFLDRALSVLVDRLRILRLRFLLNPPESQKIGLLVFPDRIDGLRRALRHFMEGAFGANHYQETPLLRGLFFSSGCGHSGQTARGAFLHDLFEKILPADRWLSTPTRRSVEWRNITGNLGFLSSLVLGIAFCGLLSFSFIKNIATIRRVSGGLAGIVELRRDLPGDLLAMQRYRQAIVLLEEQNRRWLVPRFGLNESLKVEDELKLQFCSHFSRGFLASFDRRIEDSMAALTPAVADDVYGQFVVHLTRRINLLKAKLRGEGDRNLAAMPQPAYLPLAAGAGAGVTAEAESSFGSLYLSYLGWRADSGDLSREVASAQEWLRRLLALKGGNMKWLVGWVDGHGGIAPVTLADFWGGSGQSPAERRVAAAFTAKGKEAIEALARELEAALPDSNRPSASRDAFEKWYRAESLAAWEAFAADFSRGSERLKGEREWQEAANKMTLEQGPYFALLTRMSRELSPTLQEGSVPPWLKALSRLQLFSAAGVATENKTVERAATGGKKILASLEQKVGKEASAREIEDGLTGARAYRDYRSAVTALSPAVLSRLQAYQSAAQVFGEDPVVGKSPFITALNATKRLDSALADAPNGIVARLVDGPLDFLLRFARKEAAAQLQSQWEEQVLAGTLGLTPQQAATVLLGTEGLAWKFVKGPAAPFLARDLRGYRSKEVLGGSIQFEAAFHDFLARGNEVQAAALTRQSNYSVGIEGLPTDANADARVKPHATRLEIQCGGASQSLANLNYPVGKTFNWSPDNCTDVSLQIEVGDLVLTQRYAGPLAFPEFLKSFSGGQRTFPAKSFPGERAALETMGIRYIRVNYKITGAGPVIKQGTAVSGQVPRYITRSWGM